MVKARRSVVPGPLGWVLGVVLTTPPRKNLPLRNTGGGQDTHIVVAPANMKMENSNIPSAKIN
jgi:hypothetical protein